MNRRAFLLTTSATALTARKLCANPVPVRIEVDRDRKLAAIPPDFIGLGYEISSVATGVLSARNQAYLELVRRLGSQGVIRIGGNTSDYARFTAGGSALSSPKATVVNEANVRDLAGFLHAINWRLIWGLNLGGGTAGEAAAEAGAVASAAGSKLLAFEIGNEPDLFAPAHRAKPYTYEDYLRDYRTFRAAVRQAVPNAPFAGPDAAVATDWVTRFAADEGHDLKLLTHHYYRECASPQASLARLLHPDPKLEPQLQTLRAASVASHLPFRICEVNSLCGGGKPGVSDTLGSALWILDYLFTVAQAGGAGVNIQTGVNHLGWTSWYSPIVDDGHGNVSVKPDYYGLLAFSRASRGDLVAADYDAPGINLRAYAVLDSRERVWLTVINKDFLRDAAITTHASSGAQLTRLTGPSIDSTTGVALSAPESVAPKKGVLQIHVPAASAALVTWTPAAS